ncbi:hypothetical protein [Salsuginibacillus kocurii]|uniref:hypothetical protein n=1 Tax=Salsuginibacillus kocurii TaxID=427078 RepID=UPI000361B709|nr:hypothetical protein [Salsuginibacillus kocurii]
MKRNTVTMMTIKRERTKKQFDQMIGEMDKSHRPHNHKTEDMRPKEVKEEKTQDKPWILSL